MTAKIILWPPYTHVHACIGVRERGQGISHVQPLLAEREEFGGGEQKFSGSARVPAGQTLMGG